MRKIGDEERPQRIRTAADSMKPWVPYGDSDEEEEEEDIGKEERATNDEKKIFTKEKELEERREEGI